MVFLFGDLSSAAILNTLTAKNQNSMDHTFNRRLDTIDVLMQFSRFWGGLRKCATVLSLTTKPSLKIRGHARLRGLPCRWMFAKINIICLHKPPQFGSATSEPAA